MEDEKNRRPRPYDVPKGTVIGRMKCPDCGGVVRVKVNVAGKAYAFCPHADHDGESCGYRSSFGAAKSKAMRKAYHEAKGGVPVVDGPKPQAKPKIVTEGGTGDEYGLGISS